MSHWRRVKRPAFMRDVLRDFCLTSRALKQEFEVLESGGAVSFPAVRDLLGWEMDKGLLWRLKDTSHHLFRSSLETSPIARRLDWCVGYIFHETIKLKEDAYQQATYGQTHRELLEEELQLAPPGAPSPTVHLGELVDQTRESLRREAARLRFILATCRALFCSYLANQRENILLARLLFEEQALVRSAFGDDYPKLLEAIYGDQPELLYVYAARSLRQGGWMLEAATAAAAAVEINPDSALAVQEKDITDSWRQKLAG